MPFSAIITAWVSAGRTTDAATVSKALSQLKSEHPNGHTNLDTDPNISDTLRENFLNELLISKDTGVPSDTAIDFCRRHQRLGPGNGNAKNSILGRAVPRKSFLDVLGSAHDQNTYSGTTSGNAAVILYSVLKASSLDAQKSILTSTQPMSRWQMFSFYQPSHPDDPFQDVSKNASDLQDRLGLGEDPNPDLLFWSHRLEAHQDATIPTAFDADMNEFFRPGGRTYPLSAALQIARNGQHNGLDEVVHSTITASQLASPIEECT